MDSKKGVLIVGIPLECTEREISETVRMGLHPLTAYRLLSRIFRREDGANAVFLELAETVSYSMLPSQIPGRGGFWDVVATPHNLDVEFLSRLNNFLKDEDRRSTDVAQALGYDLPLQDTQPENWAQVQTEVPQLLSENSWYRKLSVFSGDNHTGPEAENFEVWLEQVTEIMATWQVSEAEKRRRLLESLRGSAQSIMRVLKANNEALTTEQCLDALKEIFGSKEDYRTAQFQFLQSFPMPGEKVSSFLLRLEPLLHRAVQCNPLSTHSTDTIRLKHTLARTSLSCALQSRLEVLDQRGCPPTFLELIRMVREEEAWEAMMSARQEAQQQLSGGHSAAADCSLVLTEFADTSTQTLSRMYYREESKPRQYASPAGPGAGQQLESVQAFEVEMEKESGNELGAGALSHPTP